MSTPSDTSNAINSIPLPLLVTLHSGNDATQGLEDRMVPWLGVGKSCVEASCVEINRSMNLLEGSLAFCVSPSVD